MSGHSRDKRAGARCLRERRLGKDSKDTRALEPGEPEHRPGVFSTSITVPDCTLESSSHLRGMGRT